MTKLETIEQLEDFLGENPEAVILKHSSACPISARAYGEFSSLDANPPLPLATIFILEARPLSNYLTEMTGVEHKSPQALFFRRGECYRSLSHYEITADSIRNGLAGQS